MARLVSTTFLLVVLLTIGAARGLRAEQATGDAPSREFAATCDPGPVLTTEERGELLASLAKSTLGKQLLADFLREYGAYSNLMIQWDNVSYSQVVTVHAVAAARRSPAGVSPLGNGVCIHLTKKLPDIEHVADLAHELTHATRLSLPVLRGDVDTVTEFVHARLAARGGEADAFASECRVKFQLLGEWDELCAPYARSEDAFDAEQVVRDLYSGRMSASLTGEAYPVMLSRQYKAMAAKRVAKASRVSYSAGAYGQR